MYSINFYGKWPWVLLLAGLILSAISHTARAVECRAIPSVQNSAVSANNNAAGGHVNQHIFEAQPPAGKSQANKTLFTSVVEYKGFWDNYSNPAKYKGDAVNCSGNAARQKVTVLSVLKKEKIGGFNCTGADEDGICTAQTKASFSHIQLDFAVVNGDWILLTAYPTN